jgi:mannan endo-1,4-beta-mannosidase
MRLKKHSFFLLLALAAGGWMAFTSNEVLDEIKIVDKNATRQTKALYYNLKKLAPNYILFGHQDALAYGVMWNGWHKKKSDVKDVCGHYPAVFGWDLGDIGQGERNLDQVKFDHMKNWAKEVFKMNGINTYSWHVDNFATGGNSWDPTGNTVTAILPGGVKHEAYKASLDKLAAFFTSLKAGFIFKKQIPVVFRPFHEHTGGWFWWGQPHCTPDEYKALWRFTVEYLRDVKGVHNLLYAYSTDIFRDKNHYLECYPGDDYVDIFGLDDYHDVGAAGNPEDLTRRLRMLVEMADERGKVAALTETGLEGIPEARWWTDRLLKYIKADPVASRIAWVLVWRNAYQNDKAGHHYAPYPGHSSAANFIEFSKDPVILMEGRLPGMYRVE